MLSNRPVHLRLVSVRARVCHHELPTQASGYGSQQVHVMQPGSWAGERLLLDVFADGHYSFRSPLKLCWSGLIALIMLAPPCKEYSRLKLRPGGQKHSKAHERRARPVALTVEAKLFMRGAEPCSLQSSKGGVGIWANFHMLCEHQCSLVWVDACQHGKTFAKSRAFGCNSPRIQALAARCSHTYKHTSIAGVVENGVFLSTLTAESIRKLWHVNWRQSGRKGFQNRSREACAASAQHLSGAAQSRTVPTPC